MKDKVVNGVLLVVGGSAGLGEALKALVDPQISVRTIPHDGEAAQSEGLAICKASDCPVIVLAPDPERDDCDRWLARVPGMLSQAPNAHVILLSSLEVYSPDHHSVGMVEESVERRPAISNDRAEFWEAVEAGLQEIQGADQLLILRSAHVIGEWVDGWFNRLFQKSRVVTVMGHDPSIQLIDESDFVRAVHTAIEKRLTGIYNLAPGDVLPLRRILRAAGVGRLPVPWPLLQSRCDGKSGGGSGSAPAARLAYLRYSCTGSGERFARETNIELSSVRALEKFIGLERASSLELADYSDPHGLDAPFIRRASRTGLKFFEKIYWRIEHKGFEHIPEEGRGILVGPHRGFMPLDAVMMVDVVTKYSNRLPRFLLHPTLVKFGVLARFMRRLGGIMACRKNADEVLADGHLLGVYPEGIRGAFKYYREVYDLGRFGRPDYARFALAHGAPVVPFVIVGCAEIYPILGKCNWNWVKKFIEWPCLPITPTFPFLPFPLPSKWHLQILPPIDPEDAIAEAERTGREPYQVIVEQVRTSIEDATAEMREKRKSIFYGKVFAE